jgi:flagellar protein FlaG
VSGRGESPIRPNASPPGRLKRDAGSKRRVQGGTTMGMEIPGILKSAGVPEVLMKEAGHPAERREPRAPEAVQLTREEIQRQARALEDTFLAFNHRVQLSVNEEINQIIIKVIDAKTDKVIKEIPAEEIQRMTAKIRQMIGFLVDEKI